MKFELPKRPEPKPLTATEEVFNAKQANEAAVKKLEGEIQKLEEELNEIRNQKKAAAVNIDTGKLKELAKSETETLDVMALYQDQLKAKSTQPIISEDLYNRAAKEVKDKANEKLEELRAKALDHAEQIYSLSKQAEEIQTSENAKLKSIYDAARFENAGIHMGIPSVGHAFNLQNITTEVNIKHFDGVKEENEA